MHVVDPTTARDETLNALDFDRLNPRNGSDAPARRIHRLFVVAYLPIGDTNLADRLGMFITAYRDDYHGPASSDAWKYLILQEL
jgi:hypothetical protein